MLPTDKFLFDLKEDREEYDDSMQNIPFAPNINAYIYPHDYSLIKTTDLICIGKYITISFYLLQFKV